MKKLIFYLLLCLTALGSLSAANIGRLEYYIDSDPGFGLATAIPVVSGASVEADMAIDMSGLANGLHLVGFRCRDSQGKWSLDTLKRFLKTSSANAPIVKLEYFFDADPGFGNGTPLDYSGSYDIISLANISTSGLSNGLHQLYIRCQNAQGYWSETASRMLLKIPHDIRPLTAAEYFFDFDPLPGNGTTIGFVETGSNEYILDFDLTTAEAEPGLHLLCIRFQNAPGFWSMTSSKFIYLTDSGSSQIAKLRWYFSGVGADINQVFEAVPTHPGADVTAELVASIAHLPESGEYNLHLCAVDNEGKSSLQQVMPFVAEFSPQNLTISFNGTNLVLTWDAVLGADHYKVRSSASPDDPAEVVSSVNGTTFETPAQAKGIFEVIAVSADRNGGIERAK